MDNVKISVTVALPSAIEGRVVSQSSNMTQEAYDFMTSNEIPHWFKKMGNWNKLKPNERLKFHLDKYAETLGGKLMNFQVFED